MLSSGTRSGAAARRHSDVSAGGPLPGIYSKLMTLEPKFVFCARASAASYAPCPGVRFPELPMWAGVTMALVTLRALLAQAGLDHSNFGTPDWNPLGAIVDKGA